MKTKNIIYVIFAFVALSLFSCQNRAKAPDENRAKTSDEISENVNVSDGSLFTRDLEYGYFLKVFKDSSYHYNPEGELIGVTETKTVSYENGFYKVRERERWLLFSDKDKLVSQSWSNDDISLITNGYFNVSGALYYLDKRVDIGLSINRYEIRENYLILYARSQGAVVLDMNGNIVADGNKHSAVSRGSLDVVITDKRIAILGDRRASVFTRTGELIVTRDDYCYHGCCHSKFMEFFDGKYFRFCGKLYDSDGKCVMENGTFEQIEENVLLVRKGNYWIKYNANLEKIGEGVF